MLKKTIGLVGNPNCGKTTVFNALTGANQRVGNWPGVTVERKEGSYRYQGKNIKQPCTINVVDLPGVYSIDVGETTTGLDELVARDYLVSNEADLIVNIVDASNLERNLYLTTQIMEMGIPMIIALNMMDLAKNRQIRIDPDQLSKRLDCPVVALEAHTGKGVTQLCDTIAWVLADPTPPQSYVAYPPVVEEALEDLMPTLSAQNLPSHNVRWFALNLLQYDDRHLPELGDDLLRRIVKHRHRIHQTLAEDTDLLIADSRYSWIRQVLNDVMERTNVVTQTMSDRIDHVVLNRWLGLPIFLLVMYVMFFVAINVGGAFIDFFDIGVGAIFIGGTGHLLEQINAPGWLRGLLADGVGGGIQTTSTFIPQIGLLFLFLAILEDSGYLARAAFVMDRLMRFIGLPGKSFVPMMVGFGCNIPGIMATRTLENRRDRLMTIIMNPFMSCGARLPIYALFCAAFFSTNGQNVVFVLYIIGILAAIFTGYVMKNTLFKGEAAPFVMELPPYHIPTVKGVLIRGWERLRAFITKAGKMIVIMVLILGLINSVGLDGSFGKHDSQDSILSAFSRTVTPVFTPMGIQQDNWPATVGLFTGVFAKEVMVGTMDSLYTQLAQEAGAGEPEEAFDFWGEIGEAFASIPENLADLADQVLDPVGMSIMRDTGDLETAAETQEVHYTTFGQMSQRFGSTTAAIAFLLFVLLYFPCVAATAAVYRETNLGWTIFVAAWTTGLGYWVAVFYYQSMTLTEHPLSSSAWIVALILSLFGTLVALSHYSRSHRVKSKVNPNRQNNQALQS
ncbi:Fe(2+) transporter permease subunit FeoB [Spirulina subsalsa FACHB-351]|uniref:Ferrous iron transport protein B n=1 Tax=Spirulina subsalsa FACHB-351 TaxID=234711 RepID=A0ABT3L1C8_9CYAN|nr:Fe(2+) transporter permease subunit FeoB [Spirulina subsalsa]MCW6034929.1 Fe(2+) transporter permease subunit FeoB [Spirulina subsalsa FACHB-351]